MKYEIKNFKPFNTPDGGGYNATLWKDGRKIAELFEGGHGGCVEIHWLNRAEEALLREHVKDMTYPNIFGEKGKPMSLGMDGYIEELVNALELQKKLKRDCKDGTCYKTKNQDYGTYYRIKAPFTKALKDVIVAKNGDNLEVIYNEQLGQVAV